MQNKISILITGASGFVGSFITRMLVSRGYDVHTISRDTNVPVRLVDIQTSLTFYKADIRDESVADLVKKISPSYIFHFAAYGTRPGQTDTKSLIDINIHGTINLLKAAENIPLELFITAGSSSEYGIKDYPMRETDAPEPVDDYGVSKAAASLATIKFSMRNKVPALVFRLFSPFGDNEDENRFISYAIKNALQNKPLNFSNPKNVRDFMYSGDVWGAYECAMQKPEKARGEIFNITQGAEVTLEQVVSQIIRLTKSKSTVNWNLPDTKRFVKEPKHWQGDITKAKKLLGWSPKFTLEQGLKKTIEWYRNNATL